MSLMDTLRIILIGSGGREHALAWKLDQSPWVEKIYVVPGNGGTENLSTKVVNCSSPNPADFLGLVSFARSHNVNLVIPGPEAPLVEGITDIFHAGREKDPL